MLNVAMDYVAWDYPRAKNRLPHTINLQWIYWSRSTAVRGTSTAAVQALYPAHRQHTGFYPAHYQHIKRPTFQRITDVSDS